MNNNTVTFSPPPPQNSGAGVAISASVAKESEFTASVVQRQKGDVQQVGFNAQMDSLAGVTFVAFALLDMVSNALEFGNKKNELVATLRTMFGLGGARKATIAIEKDTPSTKPSMGY